MKKLIYALIVFSGLFGCKEYKTEGVYAAEMTTVEEMPASVSMDESKALKTGLVATKQKIIKNAALRFESQDLKVTGQNIYTSLKKYNAQVQTDSESNNDYTLSRTIIVRIPSNYFDAFIADISKGVSYFDVKEISAQDVTEEYIDLEARIKAKKTLEARYLELLKKAGKVSEMLEIERELSAIREEIEAFEGRLKYMESRVSLSTVNIEFYKNTEVGGGSTVSYGTKIGNALKSGFNILSTFFLGLLHIWPFILIFVIAFVLFRKRIRRKK